MSGFEPIGMALAGSGSSIAGSKLGMAMGGNSKQPDVGAQITKMVNNQNKILNEYLEKALVATGNTTFQAIGEQRQAQKNSSNTLLDYLNKASQQAKLNSMYGLQNSRATLQPTMDAGFTAQDALMDSLGLSRPVVGSGTVQNALLNQALLPQQQDILLGQYGGKAPTLGAAPTAPVNKAVAPKSVAYYQSTLTPDQVNQFIRANSKDRQSTNGTYITDYYGPGSYMRTTGMNGQFTPSASLLEQARKDAAQGAFNSAQAEYNNQNNIYNQAMNQYKQQQTQYGQQKQVYDTYNTQLNQLSQQYADPMTQSILKAYNQGYLK